MANKAGSAIAYPVADEALHEELHPGEASIATQIADTTANILRTTYQRGAALRGLHAKATGCMRAAFRVHAAIPKNLASGVFLPGKTYPCDLRSRTDRAIQNNAPTVM